MKKKGNVLLSNFAETLSERRHRKWPLMLWDAFKKCSYIAEVDTEYLGMRLHNV